MDLGERLEFLLQLANKEELLLVAGLGEKERNQVGQVDSWSAKDIIAHITHWNEHMAKNIQATLRDETPRVHGDFNRVNQEVFEANRDKPWDEVMSDLERVHGSVIERVKAIPEEKLADSNTLPWLEGKTLWRIIAGIGYVHPMAHLAECYFKSGNSDYAVKLNEQSADLAKELSDSPEWLGVVTYNLACGFALFGRRKRAISELGKAFKLNPDLVDWSKEDPDLDSIRKHKEYESLYQVLN